MTRKKENDKCECDSRTLCLFVALHRFVYALNSTFVAFIP